MEPVRYLEPGHDVIVNEGGAMGRPIIAIPARFSASASAPRFGADVTARKLPDAVWAAGGEPVVIHPWRPSATTFRPTDASTHHVDSAR